MVTTTKSYYRVEDGDPVLHGHALEHREHGQPDVVEGCDAWGRIRCQYQVAGGASLALTCIWSGPLFKTDRYVCITQIGAPGGIGRITKETRGPNLSLGYHLV